MSALLLLALLPLCAAQGLPSQAMTDASFWSNLAGGGVSARPFITDASVTLVSGGAATALWAGASSASLSPPAGYEAMPGRLSAVLSPLNMCASGQSVSCYASPNRLALVLGTTASGPTLQGDFSVGSGPVVTTDAVFDMTLNLGSFSGRFGWAWANGDVRYWRLSTDAATNATMLRVQVAPVRTPQVDWASLPPGPQCCTCDMPSQCALNTSSGWTLNANLVLQLQDAPSVNGSGASPMTGAVFATSNAVMGALALANGGAALQYSLASSHLAPEGSPMLGVLRAFVPAATAAAVFGAGVTPDALNVTRTGDPGTQAAVTITAVNATTFGADGLMVAVTGVTFSVPTYTLARAGANGGGEAASVWPPLLVASALLSAALAF